MTADSLIYELSVSGGKRCRLWAGDSEERPSACLAMPNAPGS